MTDYLEQAAAQLALADAAAKRKRAGAPGWTAAADEYDACMELAARYERLAAIDKGTAFPADPGETGGPS